MAENKMTCPFCGNSFEVFGEGQVSFCPRCGKSLKTIYKKESEKKKTDDITAKKANVVFCHDCGKEIKRDEQHYKHILKKRIVSGKNVRYEYKEATLCEQCHIKLSGRNKDVSQKSRDRKGDELRKRNRVFELIIVLISLISIFVISIIVGFAAADFGANFWLGFLISFFVSSLVFLIVYSLSSKHPFGL